MQSCAQSDRHVAAKAFLCSSYQRVERRHYIRQASAWHYNEPTTLKVLHFKNEKLAQYLPPTTPVDSVSLVHYKTTPDRLQSMKKHETIQRTDDGNLNGYWRNELAIGNKYEQHHPKSLNFLEKFADIWDGHLGRITTAKHSIVLTSKNFRPVHSAPYSAEPTARQFAATDINKMLQENVFKSRGTEFAGPIIFTRRKRACTGSTMTIVD